jgi:hypothetical protein
MRWTAVRFAGSPLAASPLRRSAAPPLRRFAGSPLRRLLPRRFVASPTAAPRTRPEHLPMSLLASCSIAWCAPERYR